MENRKKIQQSMKRYTEKLILVEKEIDNIDLNIYRFNFLRYQVKEDVDVK
jgi:hypothetical protein